MFSLASIGRQIAKCEGKRVYATRGAALIAANSISRPTTLREYRCPICRDWHL